jgi:hypothetical protein
MSRLWGESLFPDKAACFELLRAAFYHGRQNGRIRLRQFTPGSAGKRLIRLRIVQFDRKRSGR